MKVREVKSTASIEAAGRQRRRKERVQSQERARRIREYAATMKLLKTHGVKRPPSKAAKRGAPAAKGGVFKPLQIFAEGDSWFEYPVPLFGGSIIPRLERRLGVPILNLAKAGDEVRYMLGVKERKLLAKQLGKGCPAGGPWDVLLFSGGGNDIVDNPMALWIKDYDPTLTPAQHIHPTRFAAALALVQAGYEDLIRLRDTLSPGTHLVLHAYDFAIPDGRGICSLGPWLKPTFDLRNFPTQDLAFKVVKEMLSRFAAMLATLVGPKTTFINAQGTLAPVPASWHNELHPGKAGFNRFADRFHAELKQLFPASVV